MRTANLLLMLQIYYFIIIKKVLSVKVFSDKLEMTFVIFPMKYENFKNNYETFKSQVITTFV